MEKFLTVWIFLIAFCIFFFFATDIIKQNLVMTIKLLLKKIDMQNNSILLIVNLGLKIMSISIFFTYVIPMAYDLPLMQNKQYNVVRGEVNSVYRFRGSFLCQDVSINGMHIEFFLEDYIKQGKIYEIYYLPNSYYGVAIFEHKTNEKAINSDDKNEQ